MATQLQKTAVARIFADLIKADRIIDTGEMDLLAELYKKYDIDTNVRIASRDISYADAISTIADSCNQKFNDSLLHDCTRLTVSDGYCAHSEALLIMALIAIFSSDSSFSAEVFSIPRAGFDIDTATVLYVENDYAQDINEELSANYRSIFKEFQLAGFHFVYLPTIINHYRQTSPNTFKQILSFLAPSLSEAKLDDTYSRLISMTTSEFCRDLLCNKCGIVALRSSAPSLLIKIGNSFVGETPFANYLKLRINGDILLLVRDFIDRFTTMLNSDMFVVKTSEERDNQFHFHGFYKQLLEIFLVNRDVRSRILIDPYKEEILFPDIDSRLSDLNRRERALYTLLLCMGRQGLDFSRPATRTAMVDHDKRIALIQKRYNAIYEIMGGDPSKAPDLGIPEIRRPIVACLRRSIRKLKGLYNPDDYNVISPTRGVIYVDIPADLVSVKSHLSDPPEPLFESTLYNRIKNS